MRKFITMLLFAVMLATAGTAQAQFRRNGGFDRDRGGFSDIADRVYYGFKLGFNSSHIASDVDRLDGGGVQCGLNTGVAVGMWLSPYHPIAIESGLYYSAKGGKSDKKDGTKFTYDLNYLELPIVFKYKVFMPQDFAIEPFLGAYAALGVGGKVKNHATRDSWSSFGKDKEGNKYYKHGDGGLRLGCGISFQMVTLEAAYDIGLANIGSDEFDSTHNRNFSLTAGITF